jgi:lysophospholipase
MLAINLSILLSLLGTFSALAQADSLMSTPIPDSIPSTPATQISAFWQQGQFSSFQGVDNIRINTAQFIRDSNERCLVISSGRSEGYLKYQALAYDLFQQGFNLFLLDHRGQGLSQRLLSNRFKGYVQDFDDYADDLNTFVTTQVLPNCANKPYLLAHSMGSTIALRYMQRHPRQIQAAVLSSPMIAFNTGGIPWGLTKLLINTAQHINQWFADQPWYFFGQQDYQKPEFEHNLLSHDQRKFQRFVQLYQDVPQLQLGGVTIHWMQQAIIAKQKIFAQLAVLDAPILVLQASLDQIVDNQMQDTFCQQLHAVNARSCPAGKPVVIDGAWHELFIEQDSVREQAMNQILGWFNSN